MSDHPIVCPGDSVDEPHLWVPDHPVPSGSQKPCPDHPVSTPRVPQLGEMVIYTITEGDRDAINRRRMDARESLDMHRRHRTGVIIHVGNVAHTGDEFPMVITRVWGTTPGAQVNGQVFLDGTDTLWVTSVQAGEGERTFRFM